MTGVPSGLTLDCVKPHPLASTAPALRENFDPGFAGRFVVRFSILVALLFGAWTTFLYLALDRDFASGYGLAIFSLAHVQSRLFRYVLYSTIVQATVLAILAGALAILFSHKIAGPVFRMKRFLLAWRGGQSFPGGLRLRQGDQVQRFASTMESAFAQLAARSRAAASQAEALAARLAAGEAVAPAEIAKLRKELEGMKVD
jgi:hypothetical protein